MSEKLRIQKPILVEGKYDKIAVLSVADATVLTADGFSLFKQKEKQALLRRLAGEHGLLVLTDPDGAGRVIRGFLSGILPKEKLTHLYVPARAGKERRKAHAGRAGLLGVEGMDADTLRRVLSPYAADGEAPTAMKGGMTKADFFLWGLSGGENASFRREAFARALSLPTELSANALLSAVNLLFSREECEKILETLV